MKVLLRKFFLGLAMVLLFFYTYYNSNTTMGDSAGLSAKEVNFYGVLEGHSLNEKNVEHITFWNKQVKTNVFEAPTPLGAPLEEKSEYIHLASDPKNTAIATIELREIEMIETTKDQPILTYNKQGKNGQEYIIMKITFHGGAVHDYLVQKNEKIYCKEKSGSEIIELEVPVMSIKKLTINGHETKNSV